MRKHSWIVSPSPFLLNKPTVSLISIITALTLSPHIAMLAISGDTAALLHILLAVAGSVFAEAVVLGPARKFSLRDGSVILAGILIGMLLPVTLNHLLVPGIAFTAMLVARILFGGSGSYWISPAAVALAVAWISQSEAFPPMLVTQEGLRTVGDAFGALKVDHFVQHPSDHFLTGIINRVLSPLQGIKVPEGYVTLLWDSPSAIPAFRYNIFTLTASILLIAMNVIDGIVPFCFLLTYALCLRFLSLFGITDAFRPGDILFGMLTGGTLFIAFFLLPEFSISPRTRTGKAVSGTLAGLIAFLLCGPGGTPAGSAFAVLAINVINPLIELFENRSIATTGDLA